VYWRWYFVHQFRRFICHQLNSFNQLPQNLFDTSISLIHPPFQGRILFCFTGSSNNLAQFLQQIHLYEQVNGGDRRSACCGSNIERKSSSENLIFGLLPAARQARA